jgi:hypothetical protein
VKERVKKTKFLTTIFTLIILLIGVIAVPAYAEVPTDYVRNIDMPNVLLVGDYGFDLNDQENNNYNLDSFIRAAKTAYENPDTQQNEIYWHFSSGRWYNLVADPNFRNPIEDLDKINGDGLYSYGNTIAGYWLNQAIVKAIKDVNAAGTVGEMRTALEVNRAVLVPEGEINDLMAEALLQNRGDGYRTLAEILAVLKTVSEEVASTYKFSYQVPADVVAGSEVVVPVTFATYEEGDFGYDGVRFKFEAQGPEGATVTFKAVDSNGVEHTFTNEGYWGPAGGFNLPAEYSATTEWKLVFGAAGQYTITFSLIDADTEEVIAGITDSATVEVGAAPEVKGSIERDPANTGGELEVTIEDDTVTFTSGEIKWYPEDQALGRAAGNRVGVQINAPADFDTSGVKVTIGENEYDWNEIEDGDGYFWWYPLVTADKKEYTATVVWNEASTQVFKVVIGSGVTLEAEPAIKGEFVSTGNVGIAPDTAGDAAGKIYAEYKLVAEGKDISLASGNVEYIKVKVGEGGWEDLTPNTDATLWFNVEKATGSYEFEVKTTDGKKYTAILNWDKEIKTATWEATGREGEHDGKTYVEYKLLDGEAKVSLKVGDVKLIAIKEGDKWVALEPNTDETLWFNKARETGSYEFFVVTSEGVMYRATLDWVKTKAAEVDYNAVWNGARGTWYIKVSVPGEDLDADSVQTIKVIREAGVDLAEPRALTPDTDKVLWFGVAKADGDLGYKGAGEYAYEVVRKDGSKYIFSFTYDPDAVQGVEIVTTQGELVPAADYPGYENWSAVFTAAGVDFGQITKDQAIAMGLPGKDYYGVAMYLMADGVQVDLSAGNVKRVVRTDPAGDMTEPIVSGDNKYQFVHDGWGGPGQYTIVYTLKDGRVIEAKINIVSFEFKVKEPKVITGLGVLARDADKISVSNVGLVDGVYTVTATALVELPEIESGTGVVGKWFGLLLMPGGIDSITELQYKTAYTGEFRDLTDADIAESGGAEQLVWWLNGSAEFPQAIELKYKGEADDTAIKLSVNFEDPFVDISAAIAAIAAGNYQDLQVDDVYSETDTTDAVQSVVDRILANLGLEGVTAEVTRAAEDVFTVTVRKGIAEKTTAVEATFVGVAEIYYKSMGIGMFTVDVKVKVEGQFISNYAIVWDSEDIWQTSDGIITIPGNTMNAILNDPSRIRVIYDGRTLSVTDGGTWF